MFKVKGKHSKEIKCPKCLDNDGNLGHTGLSRKCRPTSGICF